MSIEWLLVRVARKRHLAEDIAGLLLESAGENPLPTFSAGSHIDIELPNGVVRQYSLCNSPRSRGFYELGVLVDHNGRGGSKAVHEHLVEGAMVRISAPRNLFPLVKGRHHVLMAGGIGITPVLSMAEELIAADKSFEMHYFVRAQERAAFLDRLWEPRFQGRSHIHVGERIPDSFATDAVLGHVEQGRRLYLCGPNAFMDFVMDMARTYGWPDDHVHSERFAPAPTNADGDLPFEIEIEGSGQTIQVAAGQTAVSALVATGVILPVSCEQGICGTCLMGVVEGIPDHRDTYLSDCEHAANDCFTPCCSRALTPRLVVRL